MRELEATVGKLSRVAMAARDLVRWDGDYDTGDGEALTLAVIVALRDAGLATRRG